MKRHGVLARLINRHGATAACSTVLGIALMATLVPIAASADLHLEDTNYSNPDFGYTFRFPKNWQQVSYDFTGMKGGGKAHTDYVVRSGDMYSRTARSFMATGGSVAAVFRLNPKIVARLSEAQLADFYLAQLDDSLIDFSIHDTSTKIMNGQTVYVIHASYVVPGPFKVEQSLYISFKNGNAYIWGLNYFTAFAADAPALQSIADSFTIR